MEEYKDYISHSVSVKVVEPQKDTINYSREITEEELERFIRRKETNTVVNIEKDKLYNVPVQQRRYNNDLDTQGNYNREYVHKKYVDMGLPADDITLRIEIRTDMRL